ncbi:MAG TPA: DMT family transporter [Gemmatimonadales bacterium]|jgi:drug/metabolite transporter (DMT)-like permease|nr:DMT family transporter [Gemmatimonadales bacterium]
MLPPQYWLGFPARATPVIALTTLTLLAFAANSLLCRAALRSSLVDPASFTAIRLASGAAMLGLLLAFRRASPAAEPSGGSWGSALALAAYAIFFSLAFVRIGAGVGALILFGAVQVSMIGWTVVGSELPSIGETLGLVLSLAGLAWLTLPHAVAPDPVGAALMGVAGIAWGSYSLRGRQVRAPIRASAANFTMAVPLALIPVLLSLHTLRLTSNGLILGVISGAVTSGLGYVLWYSVLPALGGTRAAIVQLLVPVIAVLGSIVFLGEALTAHLALSGSVILAGVVVAMLSRGRQSRVTSRPLTDDRRPN